jgi:S-adenosylmethionine:tRNA ribosyltransferase-isomerase
MNIAASAPVTLEGERVGDGPAGTVFVELAERTGPSRWRAIRIGGAICVSGDQVRFGDQSNRACFLGTVNATVARVEPDGSLSLEFEFYGRRSTRWWPPSPKPERAPG